MPGTLTKAFGGTSSGNAYMVLYRQRSILKETPVKPAIPEYWRAEVERLNQEDAEYRKKYEHLRS